MSRPSDAEICATLRGAIEVMQRNFGGVPAPLHDVLERLEANPDPLADVDTLNEIYEAFAYSLNVAQGMSWQDREKLEGLKERFRAAAARAQQEKEQHEQAE